MKDHNEQQEQENVDDVVGKEVEQLSPLEEKQLKKEKIAARRNLFLVIAAIGAALCGAV